MGSRRKDELVGRYGGDAFGNRANSMWRCRVCEGLYLTGPSLSDPIVVGLITVIDDGRAARENSRRLWAIYREGPLCECDHSSDSDRPRSLWSGQLPPLPPFGGWEIPGIGDKSSDGAIPARDEDDSDPGDDE